MAGQRQRIFLSPIYWIILVGLWTVKGQAEVGGGPEENGDKLNNQNGNNQNGDNLNNPNGINYTNCTLEYTLKTCKPFRTFQSCRNGTCACPTNVRPPILRNDLSVHTFWDDTHRQCVSKVNSVCFYIPPSILVSQPYRCIVDNAECIHVPGQVKGVGRCECNKNFVASEDERSCESVNRPKHVKTVMPARQPEIEGNSDPGNLAGQVENDLISYDTHRACKWKFQCPHLQECILGQCKCPTGKWHENGYRVNMIWNPVEHICESVEGSYCNNAIFSNPDENLAVKSILQSMIQVRCAKGLTCTDSYAFELGVCSGVGGARIYGSLLVFLTLVLLRFN